MGFFHTLLVKKPVRHSNQSIVSLPAQTARCNLTTIQAVGLIIVWNKNAGSTCKQTQYKIRPRFTCLYTYGPYIRVRPTNALQLVYYYPPTPLPTPSSYFSSPWPFSPLFALPPPPPCSSPPFPFTQPLSACTRDPDLSQNNK